MSRRISCILNLTYSIVRQSARKSKVINTPFLIERQYSSIENQGTIKNTSTDNNSVSLPPIKANNYSHKNEVTPQNHIDNLPNSSLDSENFFEIRPDEIKVPHALDICTEDISYVAPYLRPTFNLAAYANKSEMIQELIKLGVKLWTFDKNPEAAKCILQRNFEDIKPYILFLHDCGVPAEEIGSVITANPFIFNEDLDDLRTRIRYLRAHNFHRDDIARIVTDNPQWLSKNTQTIDRRLGYFQNEFRLSGHQMRMLAVEEPKLITCSLDTIRENTFAVKEQMGFEKEELKQIILKIPKILMSDRNVTVATFDYSHLEMQLSHELLAKLPNILLMRTEVLKNRHEFLRLLKRVQYDPKKPLYVSPDDISSGTDYEFCTKVAKTSIELYNMFLKTR